MRQIFLIVLFLGFAGTLGFQAQTPGATTTPPPPQSARQALLEMLMGKGENDFTRHLPEDARQALIRKGETPDSVAYDAAAWSSIIELSSKSAALGSMPVTVPDFTRGLWRNLPPLAIAEKSASAS